LISHIDHGCFKGTVLKFLYLSQNQLTVFPDLSEVASTLTDLDLSNNQIITIYADDVKDLVKLDQLTLKDNPWLLITDQLSEFPIELDLYFTDTPLP
jgi:Leucine-rich repeat (LRR) protein